ncbi:MAG TPA: hypothetical protein VMY40_08815 [Anaerolineae bacterium]|nr:hypothetical protein [Anaerolineae bacterium]
MKTKNLWKHISIVIVVLSLFVAVGTALGQEPEPPLSGPEEEEDVGTEAEISIMAYPARTMNYQGYLTDGSGNPLDGEYDMVFSLWNTEALGTGAKKWGDETHNDVPVSNGLFSVALGEIVPLDPVNDFNEQVYLEITVNTTTLPRQMLRAVPYAMAMPAGAVVRGATDSLGDYALRVENKNGRGIFADGSADATYSLYSADVTYSDEGYAGPDTYVFVPTLNAILPYNPTGEHLAPQNGNYMRVDADSAGTASVYVPIQIEQPYGRDYLLRSARIYYKANEASITWAGIMGINLTNGTQPTIGSDSSTHSSATFGYFDIQATNNYTVTTTMAPTSIWLSISMDGSFGYVELYGVRLRLDSTY